MKLPIWAKDRAGNWEVFPTYMVETLVDGSQGFKFPMSENNEEKAEVFRKFRDHFELNALRKELKREQWDWVYPIQYRLKNQ